MTFWLAFQELNKVSDALGMGTTHKAQWSLLSKERGKSLDATKTKSGLEETQT